MDVILFPFLKILLMLIDLYQWALIIYAILSWLTVFNVINTRNQFVYMLGDILSRAIEPALRPIRRLVPTLGGLDLSFLILYMTLYFTQMVIVQIAQQLV